MTPLFQPAARLARQRRIPFPVLAAVVCLAFAAAGVAVLDDYGMVVDEFVQRDIAIGNIEFVKGNSDILFRRSDRYYGLAFEMPLLIAERALGLRDTRDIYLMRHILTHLFFIAGGFFCALLTYRIFGSRWIAILAMLLFLLHPRLYAHSFINSKDIPFTVMFIIALYLMHRAFQRDNIGSFAILGLVIGLAINMRPFALILPAAILAMRALDWRFTPNPQQRKNILITGAIFTGVIILTIYLTHPYYWENPLRYIDGLRTLSQHPTLVINFYKGELIQSDAVPPDFIPLWFGITTPTAALLLGGIGAAAVCWRGLRSPGLILRPGELRFLFVTLGCFILPVIVVIALEMNIYNGWRQMYFLWAPFCLIAAAGLHWLTGNAAKQAAAYALAGAALAGAATGIISIHPHQYVYFNSLADWSYHGSIDERFDMDYWRVSLRQGIEHLLDQYPDETLYFSHGSQVYINRKILPTEARERIVESNEQLPHFYIGNNYNREWRGMPDSPVIYEQRAYSSVYLTVSAPRLVWGAGLRPGKEVYRAAHQRITADNSPAALSNFDIYVKDGTLYYIKDDCRPEDTEARFFLHVFPTDTSNLPAHRRKHGFDNQSFYFNWRGGFFDGKCITQEPLPDYTVTRIHTGQQLEQEGRELWRTAINLSPPAPFQEIEAAIADLQPAAAGFFDLYQNDNQLVYYRKSCNANDTQAQFFLHLFPTNANDLPNNRQEYGFDNRDFAFSEYGARRDGNCLAAIPLPEYKIARIRTGQYTPAQGQLWNAEFPAAP